MDGEKFFFVGKGKAASNTGNEHTANKGLQSKRGFTSSKAYESNKSTWSRWHGTTVLLKILG